MKKILFALTISLCLMLCVSPLPCFAEKATEESSYTETLPVQTETTDTPTIVSRVWEYVTENKTEMLGLAGDGLILVLCFVMRHVFKKSTKNIAADLSIVKGDAAGTATAQTAVVGAVNHMIDGYNDMRNSYEKYQTVEDDRNKLVGAVMVQNTAILDILLSVYVNSKNLPQGVKDLVTLKYVKCQKALEDDETLLAVVESVREKIGTAKETENADSLAFPESDNTAEIPTEVQA